MKIETMTPTKILVESSYDGLRYRFNFSGQLTSQTVADCRKVFQSKFKEPCSVVVFNLHKVDFIDSIGLGLLIFFYNQFKDANQDFFIQDPSSTVAESLRLTSLDRIFAFT